MLDMIEKVVRVPVELITELQERYPELEGEGDASTIRIGFKKLITEANKGVS
jgi:hypothetical protein